MVANVNFQVGELVRHIYMDGNPIGIVTRSEYFGNWVASRNGRGGDHVDVLIDGQEYHLIPEWLEKVQ